MTTFTFSVGTAADKAAGRCQKTGLDIWPLVSDGVIPRGSDVVLNYLPGEYRDRDVCQGFRGVNVTMNFPTGDVILNCKPTDPLQTSSLLFPYTTYFNASWGKKAPIIYGEGNLTINGGTTGRLIILNATYGTSYGNIAGIRKAAFGNGPLIGSLRFRGVEIAHCDDGILADAVAGSGDVFAGYDDNLHENGAGDGQSHNLYIGRFDLLAYLGGISNNAKVGHNVKTRARGNVIAFNNLRDTTAVARAASYVNDLSGGLCTLLENDIGQEGVNDSNTSVMNSFITVRDGDGPHELGAFGNTLFSSDAFRGYFFRVDNEYRDPDRARLSHRAANWVGGCYNPTPRQRRSVYRFSFGLWKSWRVARCCSTGQFRYS
jgi:hypothetical protein